MDNYDIVFLALDEFERNETIEIFRIDLTESVDRTLTVSIKEWDVVYGGIILRNSEV